MTFVLAFSFVLIFWSLCYFINTFLLECSFTSPLYAKFLSKNGLSITILQIKWYTVKCNRLFIKLSNYVPNFWKWWFNLGVLVGLIGQFLSIMLLFYTLFDFFTNKPISEQILVPVLPGVNLPSDQTIYYFVSLFISGVLHELGHAIAASREQVRVNGFGIFFMFIFPGAYVDLCSDHLLIISPIRQLRIFCAGVWHNFILVILAIACIQIHPYFLKAFFEKKVHVYDVAESSHLSSIVKRDSVISRVGNCDVTNANSYYECLFKLQLNPDYGYCLPVTEILYLAKALIQNDTHLNECCSINETAMNYCFKWNAQDFKKQHYACLPARYVTDKSTCNKNSDCISLLSREEKACVKPVWDNTTRLIRISHDSGLPILFVGSIKELINSIQIDDLLPKYKFIPKFLNRQVLLLLKYLVAFSGAIGLLNLVPCFGLDGQHILAALFTVNKNSHHFITSNQPKNPILYISIMMTGTLLLLTNMFLALFSLIMSKTENMFSKLNK